MKLGALGEKNENMKTVQLLRVKILLRELSCRDPNQKKIRT